MQRHAPEPRSLPALIASRVRPVKWPRCDSVVTGTVTGSAQAPPSTASHHLPTLGRKQNTPSSLKVAGGIFASSQEWQEPGGCCTTSSAWCLHRHLLSSMSGPNTAAMRSQLHLRQKSQSCLKAWPGETLIFVEDKSALCGLQFPQDLERSGRQAFHSVRENQGEPEGQSKRA